MTGKSRSGWNNRGVALAALAVLSCAPTPLRAQTLPNSVTCVYDALAPEQREITQYLLVKAGPKSNPFKLIDQPGEIKSLIDEGIDACIARYPWPHGKTKSAQYFALVSLILDALRPQMEKLGYQTLLIEAYVEANSSRWKVPGFPTPAEEQAAVTHFRTLGWTQAEASEEGAVRNYFALSVARFHLRRSFATGLFYR